MTAIHQFCIIGAHVMVGGCSGVAQDVPPFVIAQGNHATPFGVNAVGLKRRGFDKDEMQAIRNAYKILYRSEKTLDEAKAEIEARPKNSRWCSNTSISLPVPPAVSFAELCRIVH